MIQEMPARLCYGGQVIGNDVIGAGDVMFSLLGALSNVHVIFLSTLLAIIETFSRAHFSHIYFPYFCSHT